MGLRQFLLRGGHPQGHAHQGHGHGHDDQSRPVVAEHAVIVQGGQPRRDPRYQRGRLRRLCDKRRCPSGRAKGRYLGYLAVGRDHLSLHLRGDGEKRREPVLQSSFLRYRLSGGKIFMSSLVGHHVRDGKVLVEAANHQEVRRYELLGTTLRIYQSAHQYLEFVRIE